jgi:branched-chain amino acid transport system permease protein
MEDEKLVRYGSLFLLLAAFIGPFLMGNLYTLNILVLMFIFIIFASSWNLLAISGQGSLGHAAFFGIGAYVSTLVAVSAGISPFLSMPVGGAVAAFIGVLIGLTCVRLKEWFLAMVTFGFAIIVQTLVVSVLAPVTGGWDGIASPPLIPAGVPYSHLLEYYAILLITLASLVFIRSILSSKIGLAFAAIRENETEARASGVDPVKFRLLAFALSAFLAGIAGALEIHHFAYVTPEIYGVDLSFWPIIYSIFGGLGTLGGPVLGTIVLTIVWDGLKGFGLSYERFIIIGILLVLVVIFLPKGLISLPGELRRWREGRKKKEGTAPAGAVKEG